MTGRLARLRSHALARTVAAAVVLGAAWPVVRQELPRLFDPSVSAGEATTYDFNGASLPEGAVASGFHHCTDGWCLAPGGSGELSFDTGTPVLARGLRLIAWLYAPPGVMSRVEVSPYGGRRFATVGQNIHGSGVPFEVNLGVPGRSSVVLRVTARNDSAAEVLVLDQLILRPIGRVTTPPFNRARTLLALGGLLLAVVLLSRRPGTAALTAVIVLAGIWLRVWFLEAVMWAPLDPDAQGYLAFAKRFTLTGEDWFYSARFGELEPLFIAGAHYFLAVAGFSAHHLRLFTILLSSGFIWASIRFGRARFGVIGGAVVGALAALNAPLAFESPRGLRLEMEMLLWLAFLWVAFLWRRPSGWLKAAAVGAVGGALALLRTTYLPVTVGLSVVAFAEHPRSGFLWVRYSALSALLAIGLITPHRVSMYSLHGDPFWDTTMYARWLANVEFVGRPGFPSREELEVNAYVGPRITYAEYMFGLHTVPEIAEGTLRGYWKLFRGMRSDRIPFEGRPLRLFDFTLQILAAAGFLFALFSSRDRWLPIAFVLAEWAPSFLYDRGLVESHRHTYQGYPLFLMAAVLAVSVAVRRIGRRGVPVSSPVPSSGASTSVSEDGS